MTVYVLVRVDDYDRSEVLGVFATDDAAKRAAEQAEPDRKFTWTVMDGHPYASDFGHKGPLYAYSVEPFDVTA